MKKDYKSKRAAGPHKNSRNKNQASLIENMPAGSEIKKEEKTSKAEGLNEEKSPGNAGAFEGFEDTSRS